MAGRSLGARSGTMLASTLVSMAHAYKQGHAAAAAVGRIAASSRRRIMATTAHTVPRPSLARFPTTPTQSRRGCWHGRPGGSDLAYRAAPKPSAWAAFDAQHGCDSTWSTVHMHMGRLQSPARFSRPELPVLASSHKGLPARSCASRPRSRRDVWLLDGPPRCDTDMSAPCICGA